MDYVPGVYVLEGLEQLISDVASVDVSQNIAPLYDVVEIRFCRG